MLKVSEIDKDRLEILSNSILLEYLKHGINIRDTDYKDNCLYKDFEELSDQEDIEKYLRKVSNHFYLIKSLADIKSINIEHYDYYLRRLWVKNNNGNIYGEKFEIDLYGRLIESNIKFKRTDPPKADFEITEFAEPVFIECVSCLIESDKKSDKKAINRIINDKNKNDYNKPNTVLLLNLTRLTFRSLKPLLNEGNISEETKLHLLDAKRVKPILQQAILNSFFGSIISVHISYPNYTPQWFIQRVDNINISNSLKEFLNKFNTPNSIRKSYYPEN